MTTEAKQQIRALVQAAAEVCEDKKGIDTRILELDPIDSGLSDFFLVTSATNDRQAIAIADEIEHRLKKDFGAFPNSVEGRRKGDWILLDYVDFVVHVFLAERRAFYDIERLRKSARPLTPAEFDAELKAELAAKTLASRSKAPAKKTPKKKLPSEVTPAEIAPAKKAVVKKAVVKKVAAKKTPAKKAAAKKKPTAFAKPIVRKVAIAKKASVKKTVARKPVAKKAVTKKALIKKAPTKKAGVKKAPAKKALAKKVDVSKSPANKAAKKKSKTS
ncbi:MAG: ribosome silencing factor [Terracidiphilus sp.]|jgi:ribosome-associated protein